LLAMNDDAVCLMNRVGWFAGKPRSNRYTTKPVGAHEQREAAMAVRLTHRNRWPRNLGELLQVRVVSGTPQRFLANQFNNSFIAIICSAT
jgi:hypothetical protein